MPLYKRGLEIIALILIRISAIFISKGIKELRILTKHYLKIPYICLVIKLDNCYQT